MMKIKCAVHYAGQIKQVSLDPKKSLLDGLRKAKIPVPFSCGGEGICTTCRVLIRKGEVSPIEPLEQERANERGYAANERLSCQCFVISDALELQLP